MDEQKLYQIIGEDYFKADFIRDLVKSGCTTPGRCKMHDVNSAPTPAGQIRLAMEHLRMTTSLLGRSDIQHQYVLRQLLQGVVHLLVAVHQVEKDEQMLTPEQAVDELVKVIQNKGTRPIRDVVAEVMARIKP